jgi:hypothetical protein
VPIDPWARAAVDNASDDRVIARRTLCIVFL